MSEAVFPNDFDALLAQCQAQQSELAQLRRFVDQLLEQIRLARHRHFGARSEKFAIDQLSLLDEGTASDDRLENPVQGDTSDDIMVPAHRRRKGGRKPLPADLPRIQIVHELTGEACQCSHCHASMTVISERRSEQLDIIPATVQVLRHVRKTYGCPYCEGAIKTAPMPPQLLPKSMASPGTLAHIVTARYVDSLPLYRQEKQWRRMGIDLPRSTLAQWIIKVGQAVQPLINLLNDRLLAGDYIGMDETTIQVLKEPGRQPQNKSYLWVRRGGPPDRPIILFDYDQRRSQAVPVRLLAGFSGYLQTDGYEGYRLVCATDAITRLGCWAHVRRKFDEALKVQKQPDPQSLAAIGLHQIRALYRIEREAADLDDNQRYDMRQQEAVPRLKALREWLDAHLPLVPRQSALGKALNYAHTQWPSLIVYVERGDLSIDNNPVENVIRPFVVGRKNALFCDTVAGAHATANLYSVIETAKANTIEPYRYLTRLFTELPKATCLEDIKALLPGECVPSPSTSKSTFT